MSLRFRVQDLASQENESLSLEFAPLFWLSDGERFPTLLIEDNSYIETPSSSPAVLEELVASPFLFLDELSRKVVKRPLIVGEPRDCISVKHMSFSFSLTGAEPSDVLRTLQLLHGLEVAEPKGARPIARGFGLHLRETRDTAMEFVKRYGKKKLFSLWLSNDRGRLRVRLDAHADGLDRLVEKGRRRLKQLNLPCDVAAASGDERRKLSTLRKALEGLSRSEEGRSSLFVWFKQFVLSDLLKVTAVGLFEAEKVRELSQSDDSVARAWSQNPERDDEGWAETLARESRVSKQTVHSRRKKWLKEFGVDISFPISYYHDMLAVAPAAFADDELRSRLAKTRLDGNAERHFVAARAAGKGFDDERRRSLSGLLRSRLASVEIFETELLEFEIYSEARPGSNPRRRGRDSTRQHAGEERRQQPSRKQKDSGPIR